MKVQRSASVYFLVQGVGVFAWWLLLLLVPATGAYFEMGSSGDVLRAFWLPDVVLLGFGSMVAAYFCKTNHKFQSIALWFVAGLMAYACFYCLSFSILTDSGWPGVVLMVPAMLWSGLFAVVLSPVQELMFRPANPASTNWILAKTFIQIVVIWGLILVLFPILISRVEPKVGIASISFPFQAQIAVVCFAVMSSLGLWSAYSMSKAGKGTPLPLDHAPDLVVTGAYAHVRNPMAVSGIGQGIAVALYFGSPLILMYAVVGSLMWQVVFRPLEEEDLAGRIGADYEDYCRNVSCWIPAWRAYAPTGV